MKVGDLVKMIDGCLREGDELDAVGIIVGVREPTDTAILRRVCWIVTSRVRVVNESR
jgi:hypothetical protein